MTASNNFGSASSDVVLVVDDDELVRDITIAMVDEAGLPSIVAANADEAVAVLETRPDVFLVITDINMSGSMDGLKLAHAIRHRWPPVKIIVVSGQAWLAQDELPSKAVFIRKPYKSADLSAAIQRLAA
jgi:CheY-like chemotaxis protein